MHAAAAPRSRMARSSRTRSDTSGVVRCAGRSRSPKEYDERAEAARRLARRFEHRLADPHHRRLAVGAGDADHRHLAIGAAVEPVGERRQQRPRLLGVQPRHVDRLLGRRGGEHRHRAALQRVGDEAAAVEARAGKRREEVAHLDRARVVLDAGDLHRRADVAEHGQVGEQLGQPHQCAPPPVPAFVPALVPMPALTGGSASGALLSAAPRGATGSLTP